MKRDARRAARELKYAPSIGRFPSDYRADGSPSVADLELADRVLRALGDAHGSATTTALVEATGVAKLDLEPVLAHMRRENLIHYEVVPEGLLWRRAGAGIRAAVRGRA